MDIHGRMPGRVVVVFGATGNAGGGAVRACLDDPGVAEVRAVTRRPLGVAHAKLREVACTDFSDLGGIAARFREVDCCLFCLGTSVRNVDGEDEYRRIHVTYALAAARAVEDGSPGATFVYLSGAGAKRTSRMMWARLKAEAEDRLCEAGLLRLANVRPAAILPMEPGGLNRWLLAPLLKVLPFLGIGALDLGRAMLRIGLQGRWHGSRTYENKDLKAVLDGAGVKALGSS